MAIIPAISSTSPSNNKARIFGGVFSLKKVYRRTTDSEYQNAFVRAQIPKKYSDISYTSGGYQGSSATQSSFESGNKIISSIYRVDTSSTTLSRIPSNLVNTSSAPAAFVSGQNPSTKPLPLSSGMADHHGISDYTNGYFLGGIFYGTRPGKDTLTSASLVFGIGTKFQFSNETSSNDSSLDSIFRRGGSVAMGGSAVFTSRSVNYAFFCGGSRSDIVGTGFLSPGISRDWASGSPFAEFHRPDIARFDFSSGGWDTSLSFSSGGGLNISRSGSSSVCDDTNQYGYVAGGASGPTILGQINQVYTNIIVGSILRFDLQTNVTDVLSNNIDSLMDGASITDDTQGYGYFYGGANAFFLPPASSFSRTPGSARVVRGSTPGSIRRLDFRTNTTSFVSSAPNGPRRSSNNRGYSQGSFIGGLSIINEYYQLSNGWTAFSLETGTTSFLFSPTTIYNFSMATLNKEENPVPAPLETKGYFYSGEKADSSPSGFSSSSLIHRLTFSTEVISTTNNTSTMIGANSVSTSDFSFIGGGVRQDLSGGIYSGNTPKIQRFRHDVEVVNTLNAEVTQAYDDSVKACVKNSNYGFWIGGVIFGSKFSIINRLDFASFTSSQSISKMAIERGNIDGINSGSDNNYAYIGGGSSPSNTIKDSRIERIDLSTESVTVLSSTTLLGRSSMNAIEDKFYGYFFGGDLRSLDRFQFSTETNQSFPNIFSQNIHRNGSIGDKTNYAYINSGAPSSVIHRLNFSNTTVSIPGYNLPTPIRKNTAFTNKF